MSLVPTDTTEKAVFDTIAGKYFTRTNNKTTPYGLLKLSPSDTKDLTKLDALSLVDLFKITDPNSLESQIERAQHTRNIFQQSIDNPKQFVKDKNSIRNRIDEMSKGVNTVIYDAFQKMGLPVSQALKYSSSVSKEVLRLTNEILDNEVMPSSIEEEIYSRRHKLAVDEMANPLRRKLDSELKPGAK